MKNIKSSFSTKLFGYDNDSLPGIVIQNTYPIFQRLVGFPDLPENVSSEELSEFMDNSRIELDRRIAFTNSLEIDVKDTGVVLSTNNFGMFNEEEKEFKEQIVTITFNEEFSKDDCEAYLSELIDHINTLKTPHINSEDIVDRVSLHHLNTDQDILNSLLNNLD